MRQNYKIELSFRQMSSLASVYEIEVQKQKTQLEEKDLAIAELAKVIDSLSNNQFL